MKKRIQIAVVAVLMSVGLVGAIAPTQSVSAKDSGATTTKKAPKTPRAPAPSTPKSQIQDGVKGAGGGSAGPVSFKKGLQTIINLLLFIIGAISVIMVIIGGIRYTTSNGDSSQITGAKNTILYAIVGLVVALLAFAIVKFVVGAF